VRIKVTPRASINAVVGWLDEAHEELSLKVTAAAEGGKANAAVIELLAHELDIPKSSVTIQRGHTSRHKLVAIDVDAADLDIWLKRF